MVEENAVAPEAVAPAAVAPADVVVEATENVDAEVDTAVAAMAATGIRPDPSIMEIRMELMFKGLGLKDAAAKALVHEQSISTPSILRDMSEYDITTLCKVIRKPGGQVEEDVPGIGRNAGRTRMVPNPGAPIAMIHETRIKLARFYLKYKEMTSRIVETRAMTPSAIQELHDFKLVLEIESELPDVTTIPNLTHDRIFEWFDEFREYLDERVGKASQRPLSYVVRKTTAVKPSMLDPETGKPDSTYMNYSHEVHDRAPIKVRNETTRIETYDHHFLADNVTVWKILWLKLKKGKYSSYLRPFLKSRDARKAFFALHDQLLGHAAIANYGNAAENRLKDLVLDGTKTKNWNFDKYLVEHKEQHMILEKLKEYGHAGLSESSKVNHFTLGITDPTLQPVKASLAVSGFDLSFDAVVTSYRTYKSSLQMQPGKTANKRVNVSAVSTTSGNRTSDRENKIGEKEDGFDSSKDYSKFSVKPRFYKVGEWNGLSKAQRNFLRANSRKKANKQNGNKNTRPSELKTMRAQIAQLQREVAVVDDSDETESSDEMQQPPKKKKKSTFLVSKKR